MDDPDGQRVGLAHIELTDKPVFDGVYAHLAQPISDYSFAANYIWGSCLKLYWSRIDRHVCVFANGTGDLTMLTPPIPQPGATESDLRDCVGRCFEVMDRYNDRIADRSRSRIEYVSDELLERFSAAPGLSLSATPMSGDYLYDTARMIDLAGGPLKSKRHARSKFMNSCPNHRTAPLDDSHVPACHELLDLWCRVRDQSHEGEVNTAQVGSDILRHHDLIASHTALSHYKQLGLRGMVLLDGDKVIGFTFGEALSPHQASIMVEKTHPDYPGSAQYIYSEFCRLYWQDFPLINAGDDWGIPSLRFTKQSYRPVRILNKYVLTRQPVPVVSGYSPLDLPQVQPAPGPVLSTPLTNQDATQAQPQAIGVLTTQADKQPELRRAELGDVATILGLERACFKSLEETFNRRQIKNLILNPRATVTAAVLDGQVVGWAVGLIRQHRHSQSGRLYAVAVHPDHRGKQLGRGLAEHALLSLSQLGISRVFLEVRSDNHTAINLYRKLGFIGHRFLPKYYGQGGHGLRMKRVTAQAAASPPPVPQEADECVAA